MQERFEKGSAIRAIRLYKSFIENPDLKAEIKNSNKTLVILSVISYLNGAYLTKLKKIIPVAGIDLTLREYERKGLLVRHKQGRDVRYEIADNEMFVASDYEYKHEQAFVFVNTLMNIDTYIRQFKIASWNTLALMLEAALNYDVEKETTRLDEKSIKSILGCPQNKMNARALIEQMGVIRSTNKKNGRSYGGEFKLNQRAFIFSAK